MLNGRKFTLCLIVTIIGTKIQSFLSNQTKINTPIRPIKMAYIYQSASLISQEISWKLGQKNHFDKFVNLHFKKLKNANMERDLYLLFRLIKWCINS
jgi:hypothetical protein